jgi:hypothetical protein
MSSVLAVVRTVRFELLISPANRITLVVFNDTRGPLKNLGETVAVRFTVPEKPFKLTNLIVEKLAPATIGRAIGSALMPKSGACETARRLF